MIQKLEEGFESWSEITHKLNEMIDTVNMLFDVGGARLAVASTNAHVDGAPEASVEGAYRPFPLRLAFIRGMVAAGGERWSRDEMTVAATLAYPDTPVTEPRIIQSSEGAPR